MSIEVFAGQLLTTDVLNLPRKRLVVQTADQTINNSTTLVDTEIVIPVEAGATYWYQCLISYSAVRPTDGGSALDFAWSAPTGTALARFSQSYIEDPASTGANSGALIIQRRPANTTRIPAGGSDGTDPPSNFHSAYDRGTIAVGGVSGNVILQVAQRSASATDTILRGGNQTRSFFERIL